MKQQKDDYQQDHHAQKFAVPGIKPPYMYMIPAGALGILCVIRIGAVLLIIQLPVIHICIQQSPGDQPWISKFIKNLLLITSTTYLLLNIIFIVTHMRRHLTLMHLSGQLTSQCIQKFCSIHSIIQPFLYKTTNHYPVSNRLCAFSILTILALIRNYPSHKIFMKSEAEIIFFHSDRFSPHSKHLLYFTNIHRLF